MDVLDTVGRVGRRWKVTNVEMVGELKEGPKVSLRLGTGEALEGRWILRKESRVRSVSIEVRSCINNEGVPQEVRVFRFKVSKILDEYCGI